MTSHAGTSGAARLARTRTFVHLGERELHALAAVAVVASVAGLFFAIPHTTEDFIYHVPRTRFHLNDEFSLWMWAAVCAAQVSGVALASARRREGFLLLALTGAAWVLATTLDHGGDVFLRQPWRDAPSSTIWVSGTVLANFVAVAASGALLAAGRPAVSRR